MIACRKLDGRRRENAHAIKRAPLSQHLGKTKEIRCRRHGSTCRQLRRLLDVKRKQLHEGQVDVPLRLVTCDHGDGTRSKIAAHPECGIAHAEWPEELLGKY